MHSIENFTPTNEKHVYSRTNATSSHKIARNNNKTFVDQTTNSNIIYEVLSNTETKLTANSFNKSKIS